ncbi:hypothetical protein B1A99_31165 [Cohnella sp. CIP 111063]|uniref:spore germination protein n=1 Tax=unclassified Cohnella TaxID=2636738 RepID=UPI000B8C538A|nr:MULTISPECIES: spore germination protein [unclassified Cohnella]OXS53024.1 hypothetical protein B1A99_31165 [Cohnella sp. CIP 111063]PRX60528.1 GerA spore germination protein [Cohnella sp. SGD-V74]
METLERIRRLFAHHSEFKCRVLDADDGGKISVVYLDPLTDGKLLTEAVLLEIQRIVHETSPETLAPEQLVNRLPVKEAQPASEVGLIRDKLLSGWSFVHVAGFDQGVLLNTASLPRRAISKPEIESDIFGSQASFVEHMATNRALIYQLLPDAKLYSEDIQLGAATKTTVSLLHLEGTADPRTVNRLRERLRGLEQVNGIFDTLKLAQLLDDHAGTLFPTMLHTERPDRVCKKLLEGKVALLMDGSPFAVVCPVTLFEFLHVFSDINARWSIGVMLRVLRLTAMFFSIFGTAFYVAAITFHYQILPPELLKTLIRSHSKVPFPPLFEALLLEIIVELLREAGVRLPTKVGQTMGIVGGIVIGQAAVEAGFVSNVLLMIVAMGALASFTIPNFAMSNTQQIIRFPMIVLAGMWGGIGIVIGFSFLTIHLAKQTSVGMPYLQPQNLLLSRSEEKTTMPVWKSLLSRDANSRRPGRRSKDFLE